MKKFTWLLILIAILIIAVLVGSAWYLLDHKKAISNDGRSSTRVLLDEKSGKACGLPSADTVAAHQRITINANGVKPAEVAIKVGQTVRWINEDSASHQIASDVHPAHSTCFGLESPLLGQQDEFGYTFTKPGVWKFHDENNLTVAGQVTVTE